MKDAKFIVVKDIDTANQLMIAGFQVVSCMNDIYMFLNVVPKCFKFENIDVKKLAYTNMLTF
jgi:hypothetical protein